VLWLTARERAGERARADERAGGRRKEERLPLALDWFGTASSNAMGQVTGSMGKGRRRPRCYLEGKKRGKEIRHTLTAADNINEKALASIAVAAAFARARFCLSV
jgi:hypothetical protein